VLAAEGVPAADADGHEDLTEVEDAEAVVPHAAEVEERAGEDVLSVDVAADLVDRISGDDAVADDHGLDGVGVADGRCDAAGEIGPGQAVGAGHAVHLVLDHGRALQDEVAVRHVDAAAAPVARGQQEAGQAGRGLGEVPRDGAVDDLQRLGIADAAAVGVDAGAVGVEAADAIAGDRRALDGRGGSEEACPADGVDAAAGCPAAEDRIAADDAVAHLDDVGVDGAAEGAAVPRRVEVAFDVVVVEPAVEEPGHAPDGERPAPGQGPRLGVRITGRDVLGHAAAAGDRHAHEGEMAGDGQHAGVAGGASGPGEGDARRQSGGIEHDVLARVECRAAVVAVEVADEVGDRAAGLHAHAHDLALEDRVIFADDGQDEGGAVEARIEDDGLSVGRPGEGRAQGEGAGGRSHRVHEAIDDEGGRTRRIRRFAAADGHPEERQADDPVSRA